LEKEEGKNGESPQNHQNVTAWGLCQIWPSTKLRIGKLAYYWHFEEFTLIFHSPNKSGVLLLNEEQSTLVRHFYFN